MPYNFPSLVKETSATTGVGDYTLAGAVSGFRAFSAAVTPNASDTHVNRPYVPYVARMGAEWEAGVGVLTAAATLRRFKVLESSNAGAAVNWGAGEKEIYCEASAAFMVHGINNVTAETYPTTGDDCDDGYAPGSTFLTDGFTDADQAGGNFGGGAWVCLNSFGAGAQWWPTAGLIRHVRAPDASGNKPLAYSTALARGWHTATRADVQYVSASGDASAPSHDCSHVHGFGYDSNQSGEGGHQSELVGLVGYTTDATPAILYPGNFEDVPITVPENSVWLFTVRVTARSSAGDIKCWTIKGALKRTAADPAFVGTPAVTEEAEDAGATGWTANVSIDTTNDALQVDVVGAAATTIVWSAEIDLIQAAFA